MKTDIKSQIGLCITKGDWEGAQWTLSGWPSSQEIGKTYSSAYEFEETIRRNIDCRGIEFDSESCQFYAYAKTKQRLISLLRRIEKHFEIAKSMY